MTKTEEFKKQLALVFDDDLRTRPLKWNNYVDIGIITMIVLSTVSVFLTTFPISPALEKGLRVFDLIVQVFFTIEVSLRIWAADQIDKEKYGGFWGRVRYCFSFYGLIDFLATYPLWLGFIFPTFLLRAFRVLRVMRLFRLFHYMKAFRFLGEAFNSKKRELLVSFEFLAVITIVLSFLLYLVEHNANPEMVGNGWKSIVWAFAKYIEDPAKIADMPLMTTAGQIIAFLVGIMGIAIFAVPIGLLSAGFAEAVEKDTRANELNDFRKNIRKVFRRFSTKTFREYLDSRQEDADERFKTVHIVPQRKAVALLQVRLGMTLEDIIDTCKEFPEFRLKNLAAAKTQEDMAPDRLIVELVPLGDRHYGCYIPRQSNVTIVCPSSYRGVGIGWFTYYLALFGGFNYLSKEFEADESEPDSYLDFSKEPVFDGKTRAEYEKNKDNEEDFDEAVETLDKKKQFRDEFLEDLQKASAAEWVIIVVSQMVNSNNPADFHFSDARKDGSDSIVDNQETYGRFKEEFARKMKEGFDLETSISSTRYPVMKKNLGYTIRREFNKHANVFVLRPSSDMVNFNTGKLAIDYEMARLISAFFDGGRGPRPEDVAELKAAGFGYPDRTSKEG